MAGTKRILHVHAKTVPVSGINFTCGRSAITRPSFANGEIVFSQTDEPIGGVLAMNSRVIGPNAPRLLHEAVKEAVAALGLNESARAQWHFVPHQAGKGPIANFIAQAGIDPNKVTQAYHNVGNLTSSAIPFALSQVWDTIAELEIACPSVGAGAVGTPTMTSGMVVLGC
jgi:3-oxoacyl-[acyl-carrier-protein] synthase III